MSGIDTLDMEECITRLSACFGKLEYLISVISQKLEKNTDALTGQEREFYFYDRDNKVYPLSSTKSLCIGQYCHIYYG